MAAACPAITQSDPGPEAAGGIHKGKKRPRRTSLGHPWASPVTPARDQGPVSDGVDRREEQVTNRVCAWPGMPGTRFIRALRGEQGE